MDSRSLQGIPPEVRHTVSPSRKQYPSPMRIFRIPTQRPLRRTTIYPFRMNMKVAELKKTIGGYRTEQLRRLLVEMYKAMPKRVKEDHGIDDMICSSAAKRNNRKSEVVPDIGALASETERFVSNAYNDYY